MKTVPQRSSQLEPGREAGLVRAAQGGDQAAFAEIVRHFQRPIYRVAYALTRNASDADDLAQETFVRAYQAIGRFRAGEPLYPWLSRIAVNLTYSLFRHRKRRPETSIEPLVDAGRQWAADDDPAERAAESEQHERLAAAFGELSHEHQAVLTLRVVEDLSYDDIARTLGVPAGTVMSRLSRARVELRTRFKARSGEGP
jgi:RNA polymerase sigma-70 factor (ECF subfamily)